jgi:hypothetical protein
MWRTESCFLVSKSSQLNELLQCIARRLPSRSVFGMNTRAILVVLWQFGVRTGTDRLRYLGFPIKNRTQYLALHLLWKVPGSNFGWESGYPERRFSFLCVLCTKNMGRTRYGLLTSVSPFVRLHVSSRESLDGLWWNFWMWLYNWGLFLTVL